MSNVEHGLLHQKFHRAKNILKDKLIGCEVDLEEVIEYISKPSYEQDKITMDEILCNELLLIHEMAEICYLKNMGYSVLRAKLEEMYPDSYLAHLMAMDLELEVATSLNNTKWIEKRCFDLRSYLTDPYLLDDMKKIVYDLIAKYCK